MTKHWKPVALGLALAASSSVWAAECSAEIEGNDAMQFNKTTMTVPKSCKEFTVKLKPPAEPPRASRAPTGGAPKTADMAGVVADGAAAGLPRDYVKAGDARVIAYTKVIGGGESDSVTFSTSALKEGDPYMFFCSFPGHSALMKGTLVVGK